MQTCHSFGLYGRHPAEWLTGSVWARYVGSPGCSLMRVRRGGAA